MDQDRLPFWTLRHRVQAWNLIMSFAKTVNQERQRRHGKATLSPFVTQAYLYVASFYAHREASRRPDYDLFMISLVASFFTAKSEDVVGDLELMIELFFRAVKDMVAPNTELLGEDSQMFPDGIDKDSYEYNTFLPRSKRAELYFLHFIDWKFITVEPFMPLIKWIIDLDDCAKQTVEDYNKEGSGKRNQYREVRREAVHATCVFMVVPDQDAPDEARSEVIAGAAMTVALKRCPFDRFTAEGWAEELHASFDVDAANELVARIDEWEKMLVETGMGNITVDMNE